MYALSRCTARGKDARLLRAMDRESESQRERERKKVGRERERERERDGRRT